MLESLTVRVGADISAFRAGLAQAAGLAKGLAGSIGNAFSDLTRNATAAGAAITATLGTATALSARAAADYETNLQAIGTVVETTADGLAALGRGQRQLAKEFGSDLSSQMAGLYDALSAGVTNASGATEHMRVVNKLAVAGLTDVKTSGEAVIRMMKAYGPETMSAAQASDLLLQISNKGVTTFAQLAPGIGKVAGMAAQAGVSAQEMGAALATITGTASTDESITQLTALIGDIVRPMDGASKMAKELGLDFGAVALSTQGLSGIMGQLRERLGIVVSKELRELITGSNAASVSMNQLSAAGGIQIQKLAELFPNVNSLRAALALMAGEGGSFAENLGSMEKATGATDTAFKKMSGTAMQQWKQLKASLHDLAITVGEAVMPSLVKMADQIKPIIENVAQWIAQNPELVAQIAGIAVQVIAGAAALGSMGVALSGITSTIGIVTASLRILGLAVSALGLLFTPVGLAVAAVGAIVGFFAYQWVQDVGGIKNAWRIAVETVKFYGQAAIAWFRENWPKIRDTIVSVWDAVVEFFRPAVTAVWDFLRDSTKGVIDWFVERWPKIKETFVIVWEKIQEWWNNYGVPIWEAIKSFIAVTWDLITGLVKAAGKILGGIMDVFMGVIRGDWEQVWTGIKEIAGGIWDAIKVSWEFLWSALKAGLTNGGNFLKGLWDGLWSGIKSSFEFVWTGIIDFFKWGYDKIVGWITGIFGWVGELANWIGGGLADGFTYLREIVGFNAGGYVSGSSGVDNNVVRVSDGEFIVNRQATSMFGPLIEAMNAMGQGGGGGLTQQFGAVSISLPNVHTADAGSLRDLSSGLERLGRRGQGSTHSKGAR